MASENLYNVKAAKNENLTNNIRIFSKRNKRIKAEKAINKITKISIFNLTKNITIVYTY